MISNSLGSQVHKKVHTHTQVMQHMNTCHPLISMMDCVVIPTINITCNRPLEWVPQRHVMENHFHKCKLQKLKFRTLFKLVIS